MRTLILLCLTISISAVEIPPDTNAPYLDEEFRPSWNLTSMADVMSELEQIVEVPIRQSVRVTQQAEKGVLFRAESRQKVRTVLEWLERTHGLHFVVEPLRLKVETKSDVRDRRRRLVDINLSEFAAWTNVLDFYQRSMGFDQNLRGGGGGFDLFGGGGGSDRESVAPEDLLERLSQAGEANADLRAGRAYLWLTPEEEHEVRQALQREFKNATRQISWRIHTGYVPPDEPIPTGLIEQAEVTEIIEKLQGLRRLQMAGLQGQAVSAMTGGQLQDVNDVDIASKNFDPTVTVRQHGISCQIRAIKGHTSTYSAIRFSWVDPMASNDIEIVKPAGWTDATSTSSSSLEWKDSKGDLETEVTTTSSKFIPAPKTVISQQTFWEWQPSLEVFIPFGQALIMVSEHENGLAVFILEEVE